MDYTEIDRLMASPESSHRRSAAAMLGESQDAAAVERLVSLLRDSNSGVRDAAYNALMFMGGRTAVEKIAPLVAETDPGLRNAAIDILRAIGEDGLDVLHSLARDDNDDIRLFVLDILGTIGNQSSVEVLIEGLNDPNPNVRNAAVVSLGLIADPRAFEPLSRLMDDEEWIRFSVIEALSHLRHASVASYFMKQIERFRDDELTMTALLDAISRTGDREMAEDLASLLGDAPRSIEMDVASALLRILGPGNVDSLESSKKMLLKGVIEAHIVDVEGELLGLLVEALAHIGDRESAIALIRLARRVDPDVEPEVYEIIENALASIRALDATETMLDMDEKLAILGARVLSRIGGQEAASILHSRLSRVHGHVKRAFVSALAEIDGKGYRKTFKDLLKDPDGHVVRLSLKALGRMGEPADIADMAPYLTHAYPDVREAALQGIVSIGTDKAQKVFLDLCSSASSQERVIGMEGLVRMGSPVLHDVVGSFLGDADPQVRLKALTSARDAGIGIDGATLGMLIDDEDEGVRCAAVELAGIERMAELRGRLEEIAVCDNLRIASQAIEALARFEDAAALETMLRLLRGSSDLLRITAIKALGGWMREDLVEEIEPFVDDPNPDVARAAMEAIDRIQGVGF